MNIMNYAIEGYKDVKAEKYIGIFGNPIKHTLSPVIHDTISRELEIGERYIPFHINERLEHAVKLAFEEGILGLNITVPYKQEIIPFLTEIDPAAKAIGAVNTLVRTKQGYKGYNTDMPGLAKALFSEGIQLKDSKVIMLGAGGAARAVAYMCMHYGASRVYIVNRTFDNAKKIADDMNNEFKKPAIVPVAAEEYDIIPNDKYIFIQCTSVGLHDGDGLPIVSDEGFYNMAYCGVDLIYNPATTPFLSLIKKLGGKPINGLKMLLYQGIMAYELWNNVKVSEEIIKKTYINLKKAVYGDNIVLIGYMGSGKTTVGRYLEDKYGYTFLDTDAYIEQKENMTISEIFASKGEDYFRNAETQVLKELSERLTNTVLSTGGGMPLRKENAGLLNEIGNVFYLKASPETIYGRVKNDTGRPLLQVDNPYKRICEMLNHRNPIYENASDCVVNTDNKELKTISEEIEEGLKIKKH